MPETAVNKNSEFEFGKTKSGFPNMGQCRRQPEILFRRKNFISASYVSLLPRERIRDITSERFS